MHRKTLKSRFDEYLRFYALEHQSAGCRLTHMFAIPMLLLAGAFLLFNRRLAIKLLVGGNILLVTGHKLFERNQQAWIQDRDAIIIPVSIYFVSQQWMRLFKGRFFGETEAEISAEPARLVA